MAESKQAECAVCKVVFDVTGDTLFSAQLNKARTAIVCLEFYCSATCSDFADNARRAARIVPGCL